MPTDPGGPGRGPPERKPKSPEGKPWWQRLGDAEVTPAVVLLFFLALLVLSAAAAGVGYVAHHFRAVVGRPR